jgi:hypothetical protein
VIGLIRYNLLHVAHDASQGQYRYTDSPQVDVYNRLPDNVTRLLAEIQTTYTSVEAPRQISVSYPLVKRITADIKTTTQSIISGMESNFTGSRAGGSVACH